MKKLLSLLLAALLLAGAPAALAEEAEPAWMADGVLRILGIGNSHTEDTFQFVHDVALALGVEQVEMAYCWIGGSTVEQHVDNIKTENPAYELCVTTGGAWTSHQDVTIQFAAAYADWDFIALQQQAGASGQPMGHKYVPVLAEQMHALCPDASLAWNMIWPYADDWNPVAIYETQFTTLFGRSSQTMYERITAFTQENVEPLEMIDVIIPNGTAIMNAYQTYMGEKPGRLSRDGLHLSYIRGRYIAAMTAVAALTGLDITQAEAHIAANYMKNEDFARCAVEAVVNALANPWSVTSAQEKE